MLLLCYFIFTMKVYSRISMLNLVVQFLNIVWNCKQYTFCVNIGTTPAEKSSEASVPFQVCKAAFGLDTPVDPKNYPLLTSDPFQWFRTLSFKFSRYLQWFKSLRFRYFPMVPFDTPAFHRTICTITALVYDFCCNISACCLPLSGPCCF